MADKYFISKSTDENLIGKPVDFSSNLVVDKQIDLIVGKNTYNFSVRLVGINKFRLKNSNLTIVIKKIKS